MRELLQRLSAVDADASAAVKVIVYFDTLVAQGANVEAFLRGAAVLAGCPAGLAHPQHGLWLRVDAGGAAAPFTGAWDAVRCWPHEPVDDESGGVVWLERAEPPTTVDAVLLERLAAGVHITLERVSPNAIDDDAAAVNVLVSSNATADVRRKAARRLALLESDRVRVVATDGGEEGVHHKWSTILSTNVGRVRVTLLRAGDSLLDGRKGVGQVVALEQASDSWQSALTALRLTSEQTPVVHWDDLGAFTVLAAIAPETAIAHPDAQRVALVAAEPWGIETLDALAAHDSSRAAAATLGLHHSTIQSRRAQAEAILGFDVGHTTGRTRLALALALHRLGHNRFG